MHRQKINKEKGPNTLLYVGEGAAGICIIVGCIILKPSFIFSDSFFVKFISTLIWVISIVFCMYAIRGWLLIKPFETITQLQRQYNKKPRVSLLTLAETSGYSLSTLSAYMYDMITCGILDADCIKLESAEWVLDHSASGDNSLNLQAETFILMPVTQKSIFPLLFVGFSFVTYSFCLPLLHWFDFFFMIFLSACIYFASAIVFPSRTMLVLAERAEELETETLDGFNTSVNRQLELLNVYSTNIQNELVAHATQNIYMSTQGIADYCNANPKTITTMRQFVLLYLPLTTKLLGDYYAMEKYDKKETDIISAMSEIENMMEETVLSFQHELENLRKDKVIDISINIAVLKNFLSKNAKPFN